MRILPVRGKRRFIRKNTPGDELARHCGSDSITQRASGAAALRAESNVRPSLAFYNTYQEVDELVRVLHTLPRR